MSRRESKRVRERESNGVCVWDRNSIPNQTNQTTDDDDDERRTDDDGRLMEGLYLYTFTSNKGIGIRKDGIRERIE